MLKWIAVLASAAFLAACASEGGSRADHKRTKSHSTKIMRGGSY